MPSTFETLLAFDYGLKKIGVAVGQALTQSANPLTQLKAKAGTPNWQQVQTLIDEWQPNALVVGHPLNMDGSEQWITKEAEAFAKELHQRVGLPVLLVDERLTSVEARQQVHELEHSKRKAYQPIDDYSAAIILENYLNGGEYEQIG